MKIALNLPGIGNIDNPPGLRFSESVKPGSTQLGFILGDFLTLLFYIAGFAMFVWLVWGVFHYIVAQGQKEELQKARSRIQWALLGFLFVIISFFITQYAQTIFPDVIRFDRVQKLTPLIDEQTSKNSQSARFDCTVTVTSDGRDPATGEQIMDFENGQYLGSGKKYEGKNCNINRLP